MRHAEMMSDSIPDNPRTHFRKTRHYLADGVTARELKQLVQDEKLIKLRHGAYCAPWVEDSLVTAGRVGGRLTCVSELRRRGIFAIDDGRVHIHILRESHFRKRRLARPHVVHRHTLYRAAHPRSLTVDLFDALRQAIICQKESYSVSTLDSALNGGHVRADDVDELFATLPQKYQALRMQVNPFSESGPESLLRLLLDEIGYPYLVQPTVRNVGRVDFLVAGHLIVECDSRKYHGSWEQQQIDRQRDLHAAALGLSTFRPLAQDILEAPADVKKALRGLLRRRLSSRQRRYGGDLWW